MTVAQNNPFDVPEHVKHQLGAPLGDSDAVQLPFSTAFFWVVNGDNRMAQMGGVPFFGGWATAKDEFDEHLNNEQIEMPKGLEPQMFSGNEGDYETYVARALAVAPIVYRKRNIGEDGRYREHLQLLGMAMTHTGAPIGPVILTAKGWQTKYVKDAFAAWEKASAEPRRQHGVDAKLFYLPIGTFGEKPEVLSVGKAQTSNITPIRPNYPDVVDMELLKKRYVGTETAERMAEMRSQALDWVADWKDDAPAPADNGYEPEFTPYVEEDPGEIPFI